MSASQSADIAFGPLFENTYDGGLLLVLPYESLADWSGSEDATDEIADRIDQFLLEGHLLFVTDDDGVSEAHWMRWCGILHLVVWVDWIDPSRPTLPEDHKAVARRWSKGEDPRQGWLLDTLPQIEWDSLPDRLEVTSGVLLLTHADGAPARAKLGKPASIVKCGQMIPAGLDPGTYEVSTSVVCELPDDSHHALFVRLTPTESL